MTFPNPKMFPIAVGSEKAFEVREPNTAEFVTENTSVEVSILFLANERTVLKV